MIEIIFSRRFLKRFEKLEYDLQVEIREKIELLKDKKNHTHLKTHKLNGRLRGRYSFSVNYKIRIVFNYISKKEIVFLSVGDHDVYKNSQLI